MMSIERVFAVSLSLILFTLLLTSIPEAAALQDAINVQTAVEQFEKEKVEKFLAGFKDGEDLVRNISDRARGADVSRKYDYSHLTALMIYR